MLSDITIGQFFPGDSLLHRMDPRVKLVLIFAYIVLVFIPQNWVGWGCGGVSRAPPWPVPVCRCGWCGKA